MKTIRNLMTLAGLILAVFALSATGANAQVESASFRGTFTLPVAAQWGSLSLPAGEYNLSYGQPMWGGVYVVVVTGKTDGNARGIVTVSAINNVSTKKDALVCVREGDSLVVRELEMPELGTAARFNMPHGARLAAQNAKHSRYTQLAEAHMLIERIPVTLNSK